LDLLLTAFAGLAGISVSSPLGEETARIVAAGILGLAAAAGLIGGRAKRVESEGWEKRSGEVDPLA
jgi:hypothetical protein